MNFLIQLKCNAIAEQHFRTKLKRNLTSTIEMSQHNANTAFFCNFRKNIVGLHNLQNKTDIKITIEMEQN